MNVATMKMPREEAQAKLKEYRRGLHKCADAEWEKAAVAYEAAAEGKPLLVLNSVIEQAARDAEGRPRLAIARADELQVRYVRYKNETAERFQIPNAHWKLRDRVLSIPITEGTPAYLGDTPRMWQCCAGFALIPMTPPAIRGRRDLSKLFVLWEVEAWSDTPLRALPDRDPYLLERVAGDLYAVVGEWDLTDIERAVMRDRARG